MQLHNLSGRMKTGYTTFGAVWEKGRCSKETAFLLYNSRGESIPVQSRVTAWWPDGTVKWTAHTADAESLGDKIKLLPTDKKKECSLKGKGCVVNGQKDENNTSIFIEAGEIEMEVLTSGPLLFRNLIIDGHVAIEDADMSLVLETERCLATRYKSEVSGAELIEDGPLQIVIKYHGCHRNETGEEKIPFTLYMTLGWKSRRINFLHTFFYDGDEEQDWLKGLGLRFHVPMYGPLYNRHVKFQGEHGCFHEAAVELIGGKGLDWPIYERQMLEQKIEQSEGELPVAKYMMENIPQWDEYELCQDSVSHFSIRKKIQDDNCCYLSCLEGGHTAGGASVGSEMGSILFGIRDFCEKYPSGYTFTNLTQERCEAVMWLWPPKADAMDFRHYANRGYSQVYYEGFPEKGADPVGIACTNECSISFSKKLIPDDEELCDFASSIQKPAQYVGEPEYYHDCRAFGYWSLPRYETEMERWLEEQLDLAVNFYEQEVRQRNWYGMFNYGDFMHTYDKYRHQWRYDMGGFAWDNTELVPTLWLWLMFMRTGREDIFTLAEKLTRHTSEVDIYHMGKWKGLGSRHNVRHWGCPCKEARIAMAAHHRFYYYLTGDYRLGDIFEEIKDNEKTFLIKDPLEAFYKKEEMKDVSHARSGPDWSSLCANWLTRWERFSDVAYRNKIVTGISDIKNAPLKLISGPDFEFDPDTVHLRYIGERGTGGTHLQICMGAPQIWLELSNLLEDEEWDRMLAEYGRFYFLNREEQQRESAGLIGEREFSFPYMAAAMGAYGAWLLKDENLANTTWKCLVGELMKCGNLEGFRPRTISNQGNQEELKEIPWISTNFTAQWCLNVIMALEFIRSQLPGSVDNMKKLIHE